MTTTIAHISSHTQDRCVHLMKPTFVNDFSLNNPATRKQWLKKEYLQLEAVKNILTLQESAAGVQ